MYTKEFEVRWNDLDANMHVANSSYFSYMAHTRLSFFSDNGLGLDQLVQHQIGPVVFHEHIYYFKEIRPESNIRVSLEVTGLSEDGSLFEFLHNFYDDKGRNVARCEIMGAWIDLGARKITALPEVLRQKFDEVPRSKQFKILRKEDTRKFGRVPQDL